ncbi:oxidoreductase [Streptomyces hygroscopicus]|uniref:oxidoreductase n=1 Tax=Streptomyces hygroscopicus TaxID=1912 RepID=UPI00082CF1BE|nr:oxidoreductase [Streptomyces hygroscopicus]GLV79511.1 oxidoreductase [Streptomyces hygroscopicus subsp. hygroscopicus]
MTSQYVTFGLVPAMRAGGVLADGAYQAHRDFLDFAVDGSPLLVRLADLDAVSPLALDLGPSDFAEQVRTLLPEAETPLEGSRRVIYGCPECAGLAGGGYACGAVTAVIERDGPDVVWRDFGRQTGRTPDAERDGYHDIGPYRFRGEEYRAALERLLPADGAPAPELPAGPRALLIGPRAALLARLAAALRRIGISAEITLDAVHAHADELRKYGVVVFGRTIGPDERDAVLGALAAARSEAVCVTVLAPIVPLLVAQVEQALDRTPDHRRRLLRLTAVAGGAEAEVEVASACRVRLAAHRLDRLSRPRTRALFDAVLAPGTHRIPLETRAVRGRSFLTAHTSEAVLVAPVTR